jgi:undecaprenyl-diphosphatase
MRRLLELDAAWSQRLRVAERPGPLRTLAIVFAHSGDSWFWIAGLAILWYFGGTFWKSWAASIFSAILVTALIVLAIKFSVRRRRPAGDWGGIYRSTDPHSFPSGHAARALMLAVVCLGLGPAWLGWLLLGWAPLVALARMAMGVHYLSDVAAGALLGVIIGVLALQFLPL